MACIFFTPLLSAVYNVERLILQTIYIINKEILQFLGIKSAIYNQERFQIKRGLQWHMCGIQTVEGQTNF